MALTCGLRVYSTCIGSGSVTATQVGTVNNRPQYEFSFISINGDTIVGRISWDSNNNRWVVENTENGVQTIISYLPFDRLHPYGTNEEWENISLLTYGCLSNEASFYTQWLDDCPPSNFQFCCDTGVESENFFGVQNFEYYGYYGVIFYLESIQFSGCATLIESVLPNDSIVYSSIDSATYYTRCIDCTGNTIPCQIYPEPIPVPILTADTGCGTVYQLVNECLPISIPRLEANCFVTNVSREGVFNGQIELVITGGTPPYTLLWSNGESVNTLTNLSAGTYTYNLKDYYGDFILSDSCTVEVSPQTTQTQSISDFCLSIQVGNQVLNSTFGVSNWDGVGIPSFTAIGYSLFWNEDMNPPAWNLESDIGSLGGNGDFVNYNSEYPPITRWEYFGLGIGTITGVLGECQDYGIYTMTIEVDSFYPNPYRIQFQPFQTVNGKVSWIDNNNFYKIIWNQGQNSSDSYWSLENLLSTPSFEIINYNPQSPPTNSWFVLGREGNVTFLPGPSYGEIFCAVVGSICETENIELVKGSLINGISSWYGILPCGTNGDAWILYYDNDSNVWTTSGLTTVPGIISEATLYNDLYQGPFGEYVTDGNFILTVLNGQCGSQGNLRMSISVNNPENSNDGSIIIQGLDGDEPYQYSIDGGTTYSRFPIFQNLNGGTYVVTIKDNNGFIKKESVVLTSPPNKIAYQVYLNTTNRRTVNTLTTNTTIYNSVVTVVPSLPAGTTINFNLIHNDTFRVSPYENSSSLILGSQLYKNSVVIPINSTDINSYNIQNTLLSCQSNLIYITATTNNWLNIDMTTNDNIYIETSVTNNRNGKYSCYLSENLENFSISNLKISGCSNCQVINQNSNIVVTPTPTRTPTPTPSKPVITSPGI
jgi:hypothetical protein